jgi:hypothetical protein
MEQFANGCMTYVAAGGYTVGDGVLNVDSTAAPFPQVGNFRISIFDKDSPYALKVILKVTAINSGSQFAVVAEGTDSNVDEDDVVRGTMITADVMQRIFAPNPVLLQEVIANNSSPYLILTAFSTLFSKYKICFESIVPASNDITVTMQCSIDGGANYDNTAGNYQAMRHYYGTDNVVGGSNTSNSSLMYLNSISNTANRCGVVGEVKLYNLSDNALHKRMLGTVCYAHSAGATYDYAMSLLGTYKVANIVNAIRIAVSSGNWATGKVRLFGMVI